VNLYLRYEAEFTAVRAERGRRRARRRVLGHAGPGGGRRRRRAEVRMVKARPGVPRRSGAAVSKAEAGPARLPSPEGCAYPSGATKASD
jgi:hypothetical protein